MKIAVAGNGYVGFFASHFIGTKSSCGGSGCD